MKTSSVEFISRSPTPYLWNVIIDDSPLDSMDVPLRTAYSQAGRLWRVKPTVFARRRSKSKLKLLDIRAELERRERPRGARAGVTF
ncbi:hypothetical protein TNCV_4025411 [Trichonephila clavipes]|nr:hypothetical protein TNCV_4025411 [Trichonephila clavipes]